MRSLRFMAVMVLPFVLAMGCGKAKEAAKKTEEAKGVERLVAADFDWGEKPNNLGGDFGAWDRDPEDKTQWATNQFSQDVKHGEEGYSVKISYDVDSPNTAFNGFWMKLEGVDLTGYENLVFYVKGDEKDGYTTRFKLELKNSKNEVGKYLVRGVSSSWKKITIPLAKFRGITQWDSMSEFVIVFDDMNASKKTGSIYIDDIAFEKSAPEQI